MADFTLNIYSPRETLAKVSHAVSVSLPARWGRMEILPQHADFVTTLTQGAVSYKTNQGETQSHTISGGLVTVKGAVVTILAEGTLASVTSLDEVRKK